MALQRSPLKINKKVVLLLDLVTSSPKIVSLQIWLPVNKGDIFETLLMDINSFKFMLF